MWIKDEIETLTNRSRPELSNDDEFFHYFLKQVRPEPLAYNLHDRRASDCEGFEGNGV